MSDNLENNSAAADISGLKSFSVLWLIPLVTVLVGLWMAYGQWASQGPLITIEFASAEGLEEGKTKIKTRNVEVGKVESISLNEALDGVTVTVRMHNEVEALLVDGTQFWVVQPRIGLSGISGLGTLVSGQYIEFSPGDSEDELREFKGLDKPPLTPMGTPGLHVTLHTDGEFSFSEGDPIHYQGYIVGKIEDLYFNTSERRIYYNAFIEAPHHELITSNTRFWNASGIRAELSSTGVTLQTGPIEALIQGGISFSVPEGEPLGEKVTERSYSYIYPSRSAIYEKKYQYSIQYVVMVSGSVGGLSVGAPLLYRGLPIGKVLRVDYLPEGRNLLDRDLEIPIFVEINPGRLGLPDSEEGLVQAEKDIGIWIKKGLNATLKSQNFLLGQQLIEISYDENAVETKLSYFNELAVIPSGKDSFSKITDNIEGLLAKINEVPIAAIGDNLEQLLSEGSEALEGFQRLAKSGESVVLDVKSQELIKTLNNTMAEVGTLARSYANNSKTNDDVQHLLESMAAAFTELQPLLTELKNKPNALIFTGGLESEPQPKRKLP
jgi:paraquat-inducible protein B